MITPPPPKFKSYQVLNADCPWLHEQWSEKGLTKSAQAHYDCMPTDEICELKDVLNLDFIMNPNSLCFMWARWDMVPDALRVLESWGFQYVTGAVWKKITVNGKTAFGLGRYFRNCTEPFFVGRRGRPGSPVSKSERDLIEGLLRDHSRKPEEFYETVERMYPRGPYLDLFSRTDRPNWDSWGNEAGKFGTVEHVGNGHHGSG